MTRKKPPVDTSFRQTPAAAPQIGEEELQRRIAVSKARGIYRIAGPDDPIYRSGLQMISIRSVQPKSSREDEK